MMDLKLEDVQFFFTPTDSSRGMQYFRQGRFLNLKISIQNGISQMEGTVLGTKVYKVLFRVVQAGKMSGH